MCNNKIENNNDQHIQNENDKIEQLKELTRVVDITRRNRIQASNRLLDTEHFVQHINIYYSCVAAVITILSLKYPEESYSIASAIMTVVLAISIVYLNAQKFGSRAQQLQMNYLALHQLRFEIDNAMQGDKSNTLIELQEKYVHLLQTSENHTDQDHRKTLWKEDIKHKHNDKFENKYQEEPVDSIKKNHKNGNKEKYISKLFGFELVKFFVIEGRRFLLRMVLWTAPIIYFFLVVYNII